MKALQIKQARQRGFALLEVSIALILVAGITLFLLQQQQQIASIDKVTTFANEYVTMSKAAERYIDKYKVALRKLSAACQVSSESRFHGVRLPRRSEVLDCRLRDPVSNQPIAGLDKNFINDAFNLPVNDLIQLGFLPASFANSGLVLPTDTSVFIAERKCKLPIASEDAYTGDRCVQNPVRASPGLFLSVQLRCNNIVLDTVLDTSKPEINALCTGGVSFRTVVYSKVPLPENLPQLNLNRSQVLFKAAQVAGRGAVMALDTELAPFRGQGGLLYNASLSESITSPMFFFGESPVGLFAVYADYPQDNAVKETPFDSCEPAKELVSFPNAIVTKTVTATAGAKTISSGLLSGESRPKVMICSKPALTGFCNGNATFCWMPRQSLDPAKDKGWGIPGYPVVDFNFFESPDNQSL